MSTGNPAFTCATCIQQHLNLDPDQKVIWYTILKLKTEDLLFPSAENILDTLWIDSEAIACTGGCSLPEKLFILAAFRGNTKLFS